MRIKITLNPSRDIELIAVRMNPLYDFNGIANQVLEAFVNGEELKIPLTKPAQFIKRPLTCYVTIENDKVEEFLREAPMPMTSLIKNMILRALEGSADFIYQGDLFAEKKTHKKTKELQKQIPVKEKVVEDTPQPHNVMAVEEELPEKESVDEFDLFTAFQNIADQI